METREDDDAVLTTGTRTGAAIGLLGHPTRYRPVIAGALVPRHRWATAR